MNENSRQSLKISYTFLLSPLHSQVSLVPVIVTKLSRAKNSVINVLNVTNTVKKFVLFYSKKYCQSIE